MTVVRTDAPTTPTSLDTVCAPASHTPMSTSSFVMPVSVIWNGFFANGASWMTGSKKYPARRRERACNRSVSTRCWVGRWPHARAFRTDGACGAAVVLDLAAHEDARAKDERRARVADLDPRAVRQLLQQLQKARLVV